MSFGGAEGADDANLTYTILQVDYTLIVNIFASGAKPYKVHVFEFARHEGGCGLYKFPVKAVKIN